jgi:hypothetical protein
MLFTTEGAEDAEESKGSFFSGLATECGRGSESTMFKARTFISIVFPCVLCVPCGE